MMEVTDNELIDFMLTNKYSNYKKTKYNKPDMRCKINKQYYKALLQRKILEKNKNENLHSYTNDKEEDYRKEIINMSNEDIELLKTINEPCVICGELMKGNHTVLKCKHAFCSDCMISHFRLKNNCPLCRKNICEKPKKVEIMSEELVKGIINYEMWNVDDYHINHDLIQEQNGTTTFTTTISSLLTYYEMVCNGTNDYEDALVREKIKQLIFKIIAYMSFNVSNKINNYYDEQL